MRQLLVSLDKVSKLFLVREEGKEDVYYTPTAFDSEFGSWELERIGLCVENNPDCVVRIILKDGN